MSLWSAVGNRAGLGVCRGRGWEEMGREYQQHHTWVKSGCRTGPAGFRLETQSRSWWASSTHSPWEGSCSTCKRHAREKTGWPGGRWGQPTRRVSRALKMCTHRHRHRHSTLMLRGDTGNAWMPTKKAQSLHLAVCTVHPCVWPKLSGTKSFVLIFQFNFEIYLYLDTCYLYYNGILACVFEHRDIIVDF